MSCPDCKNCWFRKMMARAFDVHVDHLDCWEDCGVIQANSPNGESKCSSSAVQFPKGRKKGET